MKLLRFNTLSEGIVRFSKGTPEAKVLAALPKLTGLKKHNIPVRLDSIGFARFKDGSKVKVTADHVLGHLDGDRVTNINRWRAGTWDAKKLLQKYGDGLFLFNHWYDVVMWIVAEKEEQPRPKNQMTYVTGREFKASVHLELDKDLLWKGYFEYEDKEEEEEYGVSDVKQYGKGSYFCTTENCKMHYSDNPGFVDSDDFVLSDDAVIAVGPEDLFYKQEEAVRAKADGFYDPERDTYGLVVWTKKLVKTA